MEKKSRRKFSSDFKTRVVIEALKERETIEQISRKYEIHPTQINSWKREFLEHAARVFSDKHSPNENGKQQEEVMEKLYAQIGQLKVENDFLKKKLL